MTALFLAPHNDDETLFASFTLLRYQPVVVICYRSDVQEKRGTGITYVEREHETLAALDILRCDSIQRPELDSVTDHDVLRGWMKDHVGVDRVFAPLVEKFGHDQHNAVGEVALEVFGPDVVTPYPTYTRSGGRSTTARKVAFEPGWPELKMLALSCYSSQIREPSTRDHFLEALWEYEA